MILLSRENVSNSVRLKHWTKDTRDIIAADTIIMSEVDPCVYRSYTYADTTAGLNYVVIEIES